MAATVKSSDRRSWRPGERGQAIILFVGVLTIIFVIAAIVIDFGLWFAERRVAQRAADLAATAGLQELPLDEEAALESAYAWAEKNGFQREHVSVELLCANTLASPRNGACTNSNPPGAGPSPCSAGSRCDTIRVTVGQPASRLFTSLLNVFGGGEIEIGAVASAGPVSGGGAGGGEPSDETAMDSIVLLSADSGMRPSTSCPYPCPILEALDGARNLVDVLLGEGDSISRVAYVPYNRCFEPPWEGRKCIPEGIVISPTADEGDVLAAIDETPDTKSELSYTNTNQCLPLFRAFQMVAGRTGGPRPAVVFLSDGANNYRHSWFFEQENNELHFIPPECTPSPAPDAELDVVVGVPECDPLADSYLLEEQEHEQDRNTWEVAQQLKDYADIYVIALDVCGTDDGRDGSDLAYCAGIGDDAGDGIADQRLLKCIATSSDHYFPVTSAAGLPDAFQGIAEEIAKKMAPGGLVE